ARRHRGRHERHRCRRRPGPRSDRPPPRAAAAPVRRGPAPPSSGATHAAQTDRGGDRRDRGPPSPWPRRGPRRHRDGRAARRLEPGVSEGARRSREEGRGRAPARIARLEDQIRHRRRPLRARRRARVPERERGFRHPDAGSRLAPDADRVQRHPRPARDRRRRPALRPARRERRADRRRGRARARHSGDADAGTRARARPAARPDLLLLSWRRPGWDLLGTTIEDVLRNPPCDIAVVKGPLSRARRLLVPVRGGRYADLAAKVAIGWARARGGSVTLLHVRTPGRRTPTLYQLLGERSLDERVDRLITRTGDPAEVI